MGFLLTDLNEQWAWKNHPIMSKLSGHGDRNKRKTSTQALKVAFGKNQIRNIPVTIDNINQAEAFYISYIPIIQGKAIIMRPEHQNKIQRISLPPPIYKHHHSVEIALYFLFVNGSPFLHTKSGKIDLRSLQECNSRVKSEIISRLKKVNTMYQDRGLTITDDHGGN